MRSRCLLLGLLLMTSGLVGFGKLALPISCGDFEFSKISQTGVSGDVNIGLKFNFHPKVCALIGKSDCQCKKIGFVQIIRFIDSNAPDTGPVFYQPDAYQTNRTVTDPPKDLGDLLFGWAVDRYEADNIKALGYYGLDDDGNPLVLSTDENGKQITKVTFGNASSPARLVDSPEMAGHLPKGIFEAVTVPVCMDESQDAETPDNVCSNCLFGYLWWSYQTEGNNVIQKSLVHGKGRDYHRDALDQAVIRWNNQAALLKSMSQSVNPFPILYRY